VAETKTKAELEVEIAELREQLAQPIYSQEENYQKEFQRLTRKAETAESEKKALEIRMRDEALARETIRQDKEAEEARRLAEFGTSIRQDEHTRFRILQKAPAGQRDIFGDPTTEVVDLGIELQGYYGGVYIPKAVIVEIGLSIGMLTSEQADELKSELHKTKATVESAGAIAQELLNGITTHVHDFYSALGNVVVDDVSDVSKSGEADSGTGEPIRQAPDTNVSAEPNGISGSANDPESEPDESGTGSFFAKLAE